MQLTRLAEIISKALSFRCSAVAYNIVGIVYHKGKIGDYVERNL